MHARQTVEIVIPAHNEAGSIEGTLAEWLEACADAPFELRILVAEDGSSDDTRPVVERISDETAGRVRIVPPSERKGYSRAVLEAAAKAQGDIVGFCDGDGQFDPADVIRLVAELQPGTVVAGCRSPRHDSRFRILASKSFGLVYHALLGVSMGDPSSPFVVVGRADLHRFLPRRTHLSQGFWWEFFARASTDGLAIVELPVTHRARSDGKTQVYRPRKLPGIVATHLRGLVRLRSELRGRRRGISAPVPG